jgi:LPS O-antigen subunit length determinant protein (WzzB/FepE family)
MVFPPLNPMAGCFQPKPADTQYVVARARGFKSWQNLRDQLNVTSPSSVRAKLDAVGALTDQTSTMFYSRGRLEAPRPTVWFAATTSPDNVE